MKKKLLTTLLIGATLGTGISAMSTSSANACWLTRDETYAKNHFGRDAVEMKIFRGQLCKWYPAADGKHHFVDYNDRLYCVNDKDGKPTNGEVYNDNDRYVIVNGQAVNRLPVIRR